MGRSPCCAKEGLNRGAWTAAEDQILTDYIKVHGEGRWRNLPKKAGLKRCGKSCRLRWLNYLRPDIKRGNISHDEEELIIRLHKLLGNRWSLIAGRLPGRTDNEIKNYWNTNLGKKVHNDHYRSAPSTRNKNSNQSDHDNKNPNMVSPPPPPPPPKTNMESHPKTKSHDVVRAKAMRCSKIFITPPPQPPHKPDQTTVEPPPPLLAELSSPRNGLLSSFTPEDDHPTDFMLDVNMMRDVCLSDLLNSDLAAAAAGLYCGGFSYSNDSNSTNDSKDMLEDWTVNNGFQPNVGSNHHGFSSILESGGGDWQFV